MRTKVEKCFRNAERRQQTQAEIFSPDTNRGPIDSKKTVEGNLQTRDLIGNLYAWKVQVLT